MLSHRVKKVSLLIVKLDCILSNALTYFISFKTGYLVYLKNDRKKKLGY